MPRGIYVRTPRVALCHPDRPVKAHGLCKVCYQKEYYKFRDQRPRREYKHQWDVNHRNRRRQLYKMSYKRYSLQWFIILKELGLDKCSMCGYDKCFAAVEYHHPDPSLKKGKNDYPGRLFSCLPTQERIDKFKHYIPLCANCHRELHYNLNKMRSVVE